jgi:predicted tellurium resistance membrane protein TerC
VLPFTAVTAAILITFLLLPLLKNMPPRKKIISSSVFAVALFCAGELVVEAIAERSYVYKNMTLEARSPFFFGYPIDLSPY